MMHKVIDFDFVFLSYDEPNAEILYAELLNLIPWAKRVHGVKGFDSAHRKCAEISDTHFFITVDGDNSVYPDFLNQEISIENDQNDHAWTWAGRNYINGLVYGNGGLKLWSKDYVMNMNSHENSTDPDKAVEFCWSNKYHELLGCYSSSMINSSPMQAWRSGFREGVKMCLNQGKRVQPKNFHKEIWTGNINRLTIWASVGQDIDNGIWSIYGARLGCYNTMFSDWDHATISNYDLMNSLWQDISKNDPYTESVQLGKHLRTKLGLDLADLDPETSKFFKRVYMNPPKPWMSAASINHFMALRDV
jgi:hypothetical protein